ncbi:SHOCT domain-containing protein [Chitinivorax sp. PXF-14]|uniref:SHOCT domain-containing protein n=1 Tax=Chitinivorax sp. PXF-14 TaxID=3230488 RepID=UPI00346719D9
MPRRVSLIPALLLTLGLAAPAAQAEGILNSLFGKSNDNQAQANSDTLFKDSEFDYVKLVPADGSGNQQPATVDVETVRATLKLVELQDGKHRYPLFTDEERATLGDAFSRGFARAGASQDMVFLSSDRHGAIGLLAPKLGTSGRVFIRDGMLNLIVGDAHVEYQSQYRMTKFMYPFQLGERGRASKVQLKLAAGAEGAGAHLLRGDWVALPLTAAVPAPAARPAPAPAPVPSATAPAAPAAAPMAMPMMRDGRSVEERLRTLQGLRDKGLVSDDEYRQKRIDILKDL